MKQFQRFILTVSMILICCNIASSYDFEVGGIYYSIISLKELTCEVTTGDKEYSGEITIPDTVTYKNRKIKVTEINERAFENSSSMTSIVLPNSIKIIGIYAFKNCSSLCSVTLPDSIKSIPSNAFEGCKSLPAINIPNSVTGIGSYAFYGCSSLTSIIIPNSVKTIYSYAFSKCDSLRDVYVGDSIEHIGYEAFSKNNNPFQYQGVPGSVEEIYSTNIADVDSLVFLFSGSPSVIIYEKGSDVFHGNSCSAVILSTDRYLNTLIPGDIYGAGNTQGVPLRFPILRKLILGKHLTDLNFLFINNCPNLEKIICENEIPPKLINCPTTQQYMNIKVKVPKGCLEAYQNAYIWENFWDLSEITDEDKEDSNLSQPEPPGSGDEPNEDSGDAAIQGVDSDSKDSVRVDGSNIIAPEGSAIYDLNGRGVKATNLPNGIYIVRIPSGKAVKVMVK
ncbi:MAG: leucine-rich repeat domain-containing protein [Paramuribaculum sp.]|nr:leucine-rich repeat domain-containing protein [Paramuribaculum sp.]